MMSEQCVAVNTKPREERQLDLSAIPGTTPEITTDHDARRAVALTGLDAFLSRQIKRSRAGLYRARERYRLRRSSLPIEAPTGELAIDAYGTARLAHGDGLDIVGGVR
jgi:hypothetical protein